MGRKIEKEVKEVRLSKRALKKLYWMAQENVEKHCFKMNFWIKSRNHWQDILTKRYGFMP